ncbi:TIGR03086 family metal-binding protein [Nonomuraea sp. LP-02]|uniref:TIGR03086 family metal-binding protein n=1 Tax=Nonomuraea sp. LP-02 TaxID=3097960 RepID=UPI002E2FF094|nr:TIGR03086 family metal-binding protein [Nonomuraea sp. LP-02]MED7931693.1 TIGR03086 family metal-binding protein [Nonomuraea sp. LP-02]
MLTNNKADLVALDAQAVRASVELASRVRPADLSRPTPCLGWTVYDLLAHMATQHYGFAAAARGDGDAAQWRLRSLGDDVVASYRKAAEHVLAAFAADGVLERSFPLPEIASGFAFPGRQAISFHFIDYVVHSWDLAKALGGDVEFPPDLLEVALDVARAVPDGEARRTPGAAFAPALVWAGESRLDQIVAILGRSPHWPG